MEAKIRDLDPKYLMEIRRRCEALTETTGTKWSQNDYLKCLVENDFDTPLQQYKKDQFDKQLEQFVEVTERNTRVLEEYVSVTNRLIGLLLDPPEE